jgi:hypothetical protein
MSPNCTRCEHYYITWDQKFPYGCRAMGFKSKEMPSIAVLNNSGMDCLQFKAKKIKKNVGRGYTRARLI